jgi:hypothetical protein
MKNIIESTENAFENTSVTGSIIKDVSIMGTRKSKNNRTYSDTALNDLKRLSEGVKVFLDHPTKRDLEDRDGVRSVKDFAGIMRGIYRKGQTIKGNLHAREAYLPLFRDIVRLSPSGMGMSINAQVRVRPDDKTGNEVVESVHLLRSVDCVSSAACNNSLLESIKECIESAPATYGINTFEEDLGLVEESFDDLTEATEEFLQDIGGDDND